MKRAIALLIACLALGLVVAGCGGGDDDSDNGGAGGGAPAEAEEQPAPKAEDDGGASAGGGVQVSMKDIEFNPGTLTIKAGQTVTWVNDDSVGHDVTGDDFESGDAGGMNGGDTYDHTFNKAGTYPYVCSVHPGMKGTVKVKKK
jgi:plastocyanin